MPIVGNKAMRPTAWHANIGHENIDVVSLLRGGMEERSYAKIQRQIAIQTYLKLNGDDFMIPFTPTFYRHNVRLFRCLEF